MSRSSICLERAKESLSRKYFGLCDKELSDFPKPQWSWLCFRVLLVCRVLLLLYVIAWLPVSINEETRGWRTWFIFLTDWSYLMSLVYCLCINIVTFHCYFTTNNASPPLTRAWSVVYAVFWTSANVAITVALTVTVGYWLFLFSSASFDHALRGFLVVNEHGIVCILILVDLFMSRLKIRWQHLYFPVIAVASYILFHIIYVEVTSKAAYNILDHQKSPAKAIFFYIFIPFIGVPIGHVLVFGYYHIRMLVLRKRTNKGRSSRNPDAEYGKAPVELV